jgi:aromatic ring-opening dioxygenase LigB subunit
MSLVKTYIIPHGDEILSFPNPESRQMNKSIAKESKNDSSETVLIISPHSLRIPLGLPVVNTQYLSGIYEIGKNILKGEYETDRELNSQLFKKSKYFVETNFVTTSGKLSTFPVDFGTLIPLTFFCNKKVSMLGQWRTSKRDLLIDLGKKMFDVVSKSDRKISVVFSADQAHTHLSTGPYGYDSRAKEYDKIVERAIENNKFDELVSLEDDYIDGAKPDSYWNLLMFYGFIEHGGLEPKFHYYYLQEYFGMLFATAE